MTAQDETADFGSAGESPYDSPDLDAVLPVIPEEAPPAAQPKTLEQQIAEAEEADAAEAQTPKTRFAAKQLDAGAVDDLVRNLPVAPKSTDDLIREAEDADLAEQELAKTRGKDSSALQMWPAPSKKPGSDSTAAEQFWPTPNPAASPQDAETERKAAVNVRWTAARQERESQADKVAALAKRMPAEEGVEKEAWVKEFATQSRALKIAEDRFQRINNAEGAFGKSFGLIEDGSPEQTKEVKEGLSYFKAQVADIEKKIDQTQQMLGKVPNDPVLMKRYGADWIETRKADLSRYTGQLKDAQSRLTEYEDMAAGKRPGPTKTALRSGVENTAQSVLTTTISSTIKAAGVVSGYGTLAIGAIAGIDTPDVDDNALYQFGSLIEDYVKREFPGDLTRQQDFSQKLAQGAGSMIGFIGVGALGTFFKASERVGAELEASRKTLHAARTAGQAEAVATAEAAVTAAETAVATELRRKQLALIAMTGGMQQMSETFEEATKGRQTLQTDMSSGVPRKFIASESDRAAASAWGFLIGTSEAAGLSRFFTVGEAQAVRGAFFARLKKRIGNTSAEGFPEAMEEAAQEFFQAYAGDVNAKVYYDNTRVIGKDALENAFIGAILGYGLGGLKGFRSKEQVSRGEELDLAKASIGAAMDQGGLDDEARAGQMRDALAKDYPELLGEYDGMLAARQEAVSKRGALPPVDLDRGSQAKAEQLVREAKIRSSQRSRLDVEPIPADDNAAAAAKPADVADVKSWVQDIYGLDAETIVDGDRYEIIRRDATGGRERITPPDGATVDDLNDLGLAAHIRKRGQGITPLVRQSSVEPVKSGAADGEGATVTIDKPKVAKSVTAAKAKRQVIAAAQEAGIDLDDAIIDKPLEQLKREVLAKLGEPEPVPLFADVMKLLPKDENGDPDVAVLMAAMQARGAGGYAKLSDADKRAVAAELRGEPAPVAPVAAETEQKPAATAAEPAPQPQPAVTTEASGQTSLVGPATTQEKIEALSREKARRGGNEAMDDGLFGSSSQQSDLLDRIKTAPKPDQATVERPNYGTPEYEATRPFLIDGKPAVGYETAIAHLEQVARAYAGPDGLASEGRATVFIGAPGAGKSTVAESFARATRSAIVTADDAKRIMPEYDNGAGAANVHEESKRIARTVRQRLTEQRANIIEEALGGDAASVIDRIAFYQEIGYQPSLVAVTVDPALAADRIERRRQETGRAIDPALASETAAALPATLASVRAAKPDIGILTVDNGRDGPQISEGGELADDRIREALSDASLRIGRLVPLGGGEGGLGGAPGGSGVTGANRRKPRTRSLGKPVSLADFLIGRGGVQDQNGELTHILGSSRGRPGLINNRSGLTLDHARELAVESGYLSDYTETDDPLQRTVADLLDSIRDDVAGRRVYSSIDAERVAEMRAADRLEGDLEREAKEIIDDVRAFFEAEGVELPALSGPEWDAVVDNIRNGVSPDEAVEQVVLRSYQEALDDAERDAAEAPADRGELPADGGRPADPGSRLGAVPDAGEEPRAAGAAGGEAAAAPVEPIRPDEDPAVRRRFRELLAGPTERSGWQRDLNVDDEAMRGLVSWAVGEGLLKRDKRGVVRRTPAAKRAEAAPPLNITPIERARIDGLVADAVKETGGDFALLRDLVQQYRAEADTPDKVSQMEAFEAEVDRLSAQMRERPPLIDRATERRLDAITSDLARAYTDKLLRSESDPKAFAALIKAMRADKALKKTILDQVVKAYAGVTTKPKTIASGYDILNRVQAERATVRPIAPAPETSATDATQPATSGGLRQGPGSVPGEELPATSQPAAEAGTAAGAPGPGGASGSGDLRADGGVTADGEGQPERDLSRAGEEAGSDPGAGGRDGAVRARAREAVEAAERQAEADRINRRARNYVITADDRIGQGGPKDKVRANLAALALSKEIEAEQREATEDEKKVLVRYSGWGAFAQPMFKPANQQSDTERRQWATERQQLIDLLTAEEYDAARASTLNAHYTSPDVIKGMWTAVAHLGFTGGRVLEPSAGVGHFIGMAPGEIAARSDFSAVELDPATGRILKQLYGGSDVRIAGFETVKWPDGFFDLAISNVPFGDYRPRDSALKGSYLIHDYFFIKGLSRVRPGGLVAFVTSSGTLDKLDDTARAEIAKTGQFLGAVRLPGGKSGAFAGNAGTEVTTDIVFLRRRLTGEKPSPDEAWIGTREITSPDGPITINGYFATNPQMMLGDMRLQGTMYRDASPVLVGSVDNLDTRIAEAVASNIDADQFVARGTTAPSALPPVDTAADGIKEGAFYKKDGQWFRKIVGVGQPQKVSAIDAKKLTGLTAIRDLVNDILKSGAMGDKAVLPNLRAQLNKAYDAFVKANGPINKVVSTTSSRTTKDGQPIVLRRLPNFALFDQDPDAYKVAAIETYDEETDTATKAAIFKTDIVGAYERPAVTGPADALAVSLNERGKVDIAFVADMLGTTEADAVEQLGPKVYLDPKGDQWTLSDIYLSGDVVGKLDDARAAAGTDPSYARNVAALEVVQPEPLTRTQIAVPFGASWVPKQIYLDFMQSELGAGPALKVTLNPVTRKWQIAGKYAFPRSAEARFGTDRVPAYQIIEAAMNASPLTVSDKVEDKLVKNEEATQAAQAKIAAVKEAFVGNPDAGVEGWVWADETRATQLEAIYNRSFNRLVPTKYDGAHLTLPGLASTLSLTDGSIVPFSLRPHQKNAVLRMITSGNTLLDHVVGAGKTFTLIAGSMEMKRLGLIDRPMHVVPNHMLEQYSREFLQAYPNARLLIADKESMTKAKRKEFAARVAADTWDGIIITHDAFGRIRMSPEAEERFIKAEIAEMKATKEKIAQEEGKNDPTVKDVERAVKKLESRLEALINAERKDEGVTFEEMGVDMLFVDELHLFKNLGFNTRHTRIKGVPKAGSQRATDLYMKVQHLETSRPGRALVGATGTPVSNTMAEMYVMQRYLQQQTLREYGIDHFDDWASTFGDINTKMELAPDGVTFRETTAFSRFQNIPELVGIYSRVADTQTADSLQLPRPKLRGAAPIVVEATPSMAELTKIDELIKRAEAMRGKKPDGDDNMLKVVTEGRKVAIDFRLIDGGAEFNEDGKIAQAIGNVTRIWKQGNKDKKAPDKAQMIFLDMGVPSSRKGAAQGKLAVDAETDTGASESDAREASAFANGVFNLYEDIRERLVAAGIPKAQIAFIHEAKDDAAKARLFQAVRSGEVRVIIGSTGKMGVGTNVQRLLVAMHHLDAPWKPAEVEQRDGRILRQGNLNAEIEIYRYITKQSFDAYMWQTLERKAKFIGQLRAGARGVRSAEDIDDPLPEAAALKAAASGDPRIMEHAELSKEVRDLEAARRAHERSAAVARRSAAETKAQIAGLETATAHYAADASLVKDLSGDNFAIQLDVPAKGRVFSERKAAGEALRAAIQDQGRYLYGAQTNTLKAGTISGLRVKLELQKGPESATKVTLSLEGQTTYRATGGAVLVTAETDPVGLMRRLETMVQAVPQVRAQADQQLAKMKADLPALEAASTVKPFPRQASLEKAVARLTAIEREMAAPPAGSQPAAATPAVTPVTEPVGRTKFALNARPPISDVAARRITGDINEALQSAARPDAAAEGGSVDGAREGDAGRPGAGPAVEPGVSGPAAAGSGREGAGPPTGAGPELGVGTSADRRADGRSGPPNEALRATLTDLTSGTLLGAAFDLADQLEAVREGISSGELPMDRLSRLQRAGSQGFDTATTWFHGTAVQFDAFDKSRLGKNFQFGGTNRGFFFTTSERFASTGGWPSRVMRRTHLRMTNPLTVDVRRALIGSVGPASPAASFFAKIDNWLQRLVVGVMPQFSLIEPHFDAIAAKAYMAGHDGIIFDFGPKSLMGKVAIVPEPNQIRDVDAAFDPALTQASNLMFSIAGQKAIGARKSVIPAAERMEQRGKTPDQIREVTGWFRGPDGKWRFEIDDSRAKLKPLDTVLAAPKTSFFRSMLGMRSKQTPKWVAGAVKTGAGIPLGDLLEHDALFKAYPFLKQMKANVIVGPGVPENKEGGSIVYRTDGNKIIYSPIQVRARTDGEVLKTLMHEIQHYIQNREGFAGGSSPSKARNDLDPFGADFSQQTDGPLLYNKRQFSTGTQRNAATLRDDGILPSTRAEDIAMRLAELHEQRDAGVRSVENPIRSIFDSLRYLDIDKVIGTLQAELVNLLTVTTGDYVNSVGEAEANAVMARLTMTPEERRLIGVEYGEATGQNKPTRDFREVADEMLRRAAFSKRRRRELQQPEQVAPDITVRANPYTNPNAEPMAPQYTVTLKRLDGEGSQIWFTLDYDTGYGVMQLGDLHRSDLGYYDADYSSGATARPDPEIEDDRPNPVTDDELKRLVDATEAYIRRRNLTPTADPRLSRNSLPDAVGLDQVGFDTSTGSSNLLSENAFAFWRGRDPYFMMDTAQARKLDEVSGTDATVISQVKEMPFEFRRARLDPEAWKARTGEFEEANASDMHAAFVTYLARREAEIDHLQSLKDDARRRYEAGKGGQAQWDQMLAEHRALDDQIAAQFKKRSGAMWLITSEMMRPQVAKWRLAHDKSLKSERDVEAAYVQVRTNKAFVTAATPLVLANKYTETATKADAAQWLKESNLNELYSHGLEDVVQLARIHGDDFQRAEVDGAIASVESNALIEEIRAAGGLSPYSLEDRRNAPSLAEQRELMREVTALTGEETTGSTMFSLLAQDTATGQDMRRDLDALGYFSQALEAAKGLKQGKGTPQQMLAMLKKEGVKQAEIEATKLAAFLDGKASVTKSDIVKHLEDNRVALNQRVYGGRDVQAFQPGVPIDDLPDGVDGGAKWSNHTLDPSNPTYRETVLHLPEATDAQRLKRMAEYEARGERVPANSETFRAGHFPEPNIIGHLMTSLNKHEGKPVFTLDQIQSDWGQKLRDGGVRDEAKAKALRVRETELRSRLLPEAYEELAAFDFDYLALMKAFDSISKTLTNPAEVAKSLTDFGAANGAELKRVRAEAYGAEQGSPGHPLVNTTDQWVNTTLRRAIHQAIAAGADAIAIPHGDTVLSYNPGDTNGMRSFYGSRTAEGIVPKNLRKMLERIDSTIKPQRVEKLETPTGLKGWKGERNGVYASPNPQAGIDTPRQVDPGQTGFTLFPITEKVRDQVLAEGLPLFSLQPQSSVADFDYSPAFARAADELQGKLQDIIDRLPAPVRLVVRDRLTIRDVQMLTGDPVSRGAIGDTSVGAFYNDTKKIIGLAVDPNALENLSHEELHALRDLGLIADAEYRILQNAATKVLPLKTALAAIGLRQKALGASVPAVKREMDALRKKARGDGVSLREIYQVDDFYAALYAPRFGVDARINADGRLSLAGPEDGLRRLEDKMIEEAVAAMVGQRAAGLDIGAKPNGLLDRIAQFIERLGNVLRGLGFRSLSDVFTAKDSGAMGRRPVNSNAPFGNLYQLQERPKPSHRQLAQMIMAGIKAGRATNVAPEFVGQVLDTVKGLPPVPGEGLIGQLARVEPAKSEADRQTGAARFIFKMPDGRQFAYTLPMLIVLQNRALHIGDHGDILLTRLGSVSDERLGAPQLQDAVTGQGDRSAAGVQSSETGKERPGLVDSFDLTARIIRGEVVHEAIHRLRRQGLIAPATFDALLAHSEALQLLDGQTSTYLKMIGDSAASRAASDRTLRESYEAQYSTSPTKQEQMAQEAVTHLFELIAHNALLPMEIDPVRDLVEEVMPGLLAESQRLPFFALDPFAKMREQIEQARRAAAEGAAKVAETTGEDSSEIRERLLADARKRLAEGFDAFRPGNDRGAFAPSQTPDPLASGQFAGSITGTAPAGPTTTTTGGTGTTGTGGTGGGASTPPASPAATAPGRTEKVRGISDLVADLNNALGLTTRQGRLNPGLKRQAAMAGGELAGQFDKVSGIARLAIPNDFATLSHEAGHKMETMPALRAGIVKLKADHGGALRPLASPGPDRMSEGFAEFVRMYIVDPDAAEARMPSLMQAFEDLLDARVPQLLTDLQALQQAYQTLIDASPKAIVLSRTKSTATTHGAIARLFAGSKALAKSYAEAVADRWRVANGFGAKVAAPLVLPIQMHEAWYATQLGYLDRGHPLKVAVQQLLELAQDNIEPSLAARERLGLKAIDDPYKLFRMHEHSRVAATATLQNGVVFKDEVDPVGPSLNDVLVRAFGSSGKSDWNEDKAQEFGAFLIARRMVAEWDRYHAGHLANPPDSLLPESHWRAAAAVDVNDRSFEDAAELYYQFNRNMLRLKHENGFITDKQYQEFVSRIDYAPLQRIMDDGAPGSGTDDKRNKRKLIHQFKGSTRDFINPIEATIADVYATQNRIATNDIIRAMDRLARAAGPGGGAIAERIPAKDMKGVAVGVRELLHNALKQLGISGAGLSEAGLLDPNTPDQVHALRDIVDDLFDQNAMATVFRATDTNERGEPIVYLWEDGKRVPIRIGDTAVARDIFDTFVALGQNNSDFVMDFLSLGSTALRFGVTKAPAYIVTNWFRDQLATWVLSEDFKPFATGLRGALLAAQNPEWVNRYSVFAGMMGGIDTNRVAQARVHHDMLALRKKGILAAPTKLESSMRLLEMSEFASRLGHFEAVFRRAKADGFSDREAMVEAGFVAHDVMDFSMRGNTVSMNLGARYVPFLNAKFQGLYAAIRSATGERDRGRAVRAAISPYVQGASGQPLTVVQRRRMPISVSMWVKMMAMGFAGLALHAVYKDDPEKEEFGDYMNATHWFVKIQGKWVRIPKVFELSSIGNAMEAAYDWLVKEDPRAGKRFMNSLRDTVGFPLSNIANLMQAAFYGATGDSEKANAALAKAVDPDIDVPLIKLFYEWKTGTDTFRDRGIIQEQLKKLPPELQFTAYTSELGRAIGQKMGWSPAMVDHMVMSLLGTLGRDALSASNALNPRRPDQAMEDMMFMSRFTRRAARGSLSIEEFWKQMAQSGGQMVRAASGYAEFLKSGQPREAREFLDRLKPDEQAYALLQKYFPAADKQLHPLARANTVMATMSGIRKELILDRLIKQDSQPTARKPGNEQEKIVLSTADMGKVNNILEDLTMREARNALIVMGHPGWAQKKVMETDELLKELRSVSADVADEMEARLTKKRGAEKVYSFEEVRRAWPQVKDTILKNRDDIVSGEAKGLLGELRGDVKAGGSMFPSRR